MLFDKFVVNAGGEDRVHRMRNILHEFEEEEDEDADVGVLDSSTEEHPRPITPMLLVSHPRKLNFDDDEDMNVSDDEGIKGNIGLTRGKQNQIYDGTALARANMGCSPPYKRVKALKLFDSPATPKTIMQRSVMHTPIPNKSFVSRFLHPNQNTDKPKAVPCDRTEDKPTANINPFTPNGQLLTARKRTRSKRNLIESPELRISKLVYSDESEEEIEQPTKRVALRETNISRYHEEFVELELLGSGEFGSVFKCIHRLDGCFYAVKKSIKPLTGSIMSKNAQNEVFAHAVLGKHQHVVRYYSAWKEDNHMIIQNEYCNGGSLADAIQKHREENKFFTETEIRQLMLHVAEGLRYIHSNNLVHMDIKPGNIFISREKSQLRVNYDSEDDGFDEEEAEEEVTYKIGDLGHVTLISSPQVEEGDCRYLPSEILQEDFAHLTKADIFALGLTIYETAGAGPLPKNGHEWHEIRKGNLKELPRYSRDLNELLKLMVHPNPEMRPSALNLIQHRVLTPNGNKSKTQLRRELNAERLKNEILSKQLEEAAKCIKTIAPNLGISNVLTPPTIGYKLRPTPVRTSNSNRAVGKKCSRSSSTTNF